MSGKISGTTSNQPATAVAGSVGQRAAATASPATGGASAIARATENVQITDTASHLVTAEQALNEVPVINPGRVAQARESLASGSYRVSPERISDQLLKFERLLPDEAAE